MRLSFLATFVLCSSVSTILRAEVISRKGGNLLQNLTRTQEYENHVVTSPLDTMQPMIWMYRGLRNVYNRIFGPTGQRREGSVQERVPNNVPFPCNVNYCQGKKPPRTVHELTPCDINVVAALGDSLTSATAANSQYLWEVLIENRGLAWSIGGQETWRTFLTLPNILKEYNPTLVGYSLSDSYNVHPQSQFNVAENIATVTDMPYNAKVLMNRMSADMRVSMKRHWKLLTLMIGGNDFCSDVCYQTNATEWMNEVQAHDLVKTLEYLRDNSPRTLVNLVPSPLVSLLFSTDGMDVPISCNLARPIECSCLYGPAYSKSRYLYRRLSDKFIETMEQISFLPHLHTDDFTVVFQPFFANASVWYPSSNKPDMTILSVDCLHLSQKGHAVGANGLWNNMAEPIGRKTRGFRPLFSEFKCPNYGRPFIFTNYNSR